VNRASSPKPAQPNQSVEWGIRCLMELTSDGSPVTCNEMAKRLGVGRMKASRLLGTLAYLGMAERREDLSYVPGPGIHVLSAMSLRSSGLLRHALPHIESIQHKWNVSARLGVVWHSQVSFLYHSDGGRGLIDSIAGARSWPAAKSAVGRAILARLDDAEVRAQTGDSLTPEEVAGLMHVLRETRRRGYLLYPGVTIAVALGTPATAGIAFRGASVTEDNLALIDDVHAAAQAIATRVEAEMTTACPQRITK